MKATIRDPRRKQKCAFQFPKELLLPDTLEEIEAGRPAQQSPLPEESRQERVGRLLAGARWPRRRRPRG